MDKDNRNILENKNLALIKGVDFDIEDCNLKHESKPLRDKGLWFRLLSELNNEDDNIILSLKAEVNNSDWTDSEKMFWDTILSIKSHAPAEKMKKQITFLTGKTDRLSEICQLVLNEGIRQEEMYRQSIRSQEQRILSRKINEVSEVQRDLEDAEYNLQQHRRSPN